MLTSTCLASRRRSSTRTRSRPRRNKRVADCFLLAFELMLPPACSDNPKSSTSYPHYIGRFQCSPHVFPLAAPRRLRPTIRYIHDPPGWHRSYPSLHTCPFTVLLSRIDVVSPGYGSALECRLDRALLIYPFSTEACSPTCEALKMDVAVVAHVQYSRVLCTLHAPWKVLMIFATPTISQYRYSCSTQAVAQM